MMSDFPSSWKKMLLEDCMSVIIDYRGKTPRKVPFGVPLITAKIIKDSRIGTIDEYIAFEDYDTWMNRGLPQIGDVVMTTEGPLGEIAQLDERKVALGQRIITLRGYADVLDNTFLKFQMISSYVQNQLFARATGTTVLGIRQSELRKIYLSIPPLPEQQAIAHMLGSLDDKIELNLQMNETLEGIARALFKSWFVDFDPVRAKMEGRQPFGMDEETAGLFPDGFEDSRLGEVPKGWKVTTLGDVVALNELTLNKFFPFSEIEYVDISSVSMGKLEKTAKYILEMAPSRAKRLVKHGDTIWSTVRPNRKSYLFIQNPQDNIVVSTGFVVLSPKSIPPTYLYTWVTTDHFVDYLTYSADGSAYPAVLPSRFSSAIILFPDIHILQKFEQVIGPIYSHIAQNNEESQTLSTLRDTLLPKLLSGEIRIKQAEREVEAIL